MKKIADFIVDKRKYVMMLYLIILVLSAVGMLHVNVNYDMSKYLPKDSSTKLGMEKMSSEYGDLASITVMFDGLDESEQLRMKEDLASISNVKSVVYLQEDETYQKDGHSKYMIAVSAGTYSKEAGETLKEIKDRYQDYDIAVSGAVVDNDLLIRTLADEIPVIAVIVVIIIFMILFLLCDSWIEPFLFMGCIGVAILINMGTNTLLPSVSFMTFAVGALLQLGLSMDYSIMLINRYNQEKLENPTPAVAMKKALFHAFGAITSSSVTTIVGLLALVFMSFKIGQDMGIVLAKGVFISLICIFTILPGLVIIFDKLIMKTHKKSLNFKVDFLMRAVTKARFVLIPVVAVVIIFAVTLKGGLGIGYVKTFDNEDQKKIENVFGIDNQVVLLYDRSEEPEKLAEYIRWLEGQENVNSVQDYSNTIGKEYTYKELAEDMDMTEAQAKMMYQMYQESKNGSTYEKITMYDLICYLAEDVAGNPAYAEFMTEEQIAQIQDAKKELEDGKIKMADAEQKIKDGEKELSDGEAELLDGEAEIVKNEQILNESEKELADGEAKIAESEKQISDGEMQIAAAEADLAENEKQIADGEAQIAVARQQMIDMGMTEETINGQLAEREQALAAARMQLEAGKEELALRKQELADGRAELEKGKQELADGREQLANGRSQIEKAKQELAQGKQELADGRAELEKGKQELEESKDIYEKPMTVEELAEVMEEDASAVEEMLKIRKMSMIDVENDRMSLEEFVEFITKEVLPKETYAKAITDDMRKELADGQKEIADNKELMLGKTYNRMMVSLALPLEGDETFTFIGEMSEKAENMFAGEVWLVGDSTMGYEMDLGFSDELNFVTILTIVAILAVVIITFHSFVSSATLVAVIQAAVYIVTAIVAVMGISVNYIALILVQCILMGSTIDYGILFISNYREMRQEKDKVEAVASAMNYSIKTIMTSSLILISCCLTVGFIMTQEIIAQTCSVIAYGALCAVILVIFLLPALAYVLDRFVVKKKKEVH